MRAERWSVISEKRRRKWREVEEKGQCGEEACQPACMSIVYSPFTSLICTRTVAEADNDGVP
jgi:hypothetical protein